MGLPHMCISQYNKVLLLQKGTLKLSTMHQACVLISLENKLPLLKPNFLNIGYRNISDRLIKAMEQELNPASKIPHRNQYWCHQYQESFREGWRTTQPLPFSCCKLILVIKIDHKTFYQTSNISKLLTSAIQASPRNLHSALHHLFFEHEVYS